MELTPSLDTWTIIFSAVAFHGIVLSVLFFFRSSRHKRADWLLGIFILLFSVNLFNNVLFWTNYNLEFPHLMGMSAPVHFLYGPVLFLYVLFVVDPKRNWKRIDALHFAPALIYLVWLLPFYFTSAEGKVNFLLNAFDGNSKYEGMASGTPFIVYVKSLHMLGYAGAIFWILHPSRSWLKDKVSKLADESARWLRVIRYSFIGFVASYIGFFILVATIRFSVEHDYIIAVAMSGFIFTVGYLGFFKPEYLQEAHRINGRYEKSSLTGKEAGRYLDRLLEYMEETKPYMDGDLRMDDLAEELSIPSHHLSQIINERLGKNFFEFVNSYRVAEAKKMLSDPGKREYKILRIALESGFNNKTTFNNAFKNEVGATPSSFRDSMLNGKELAGNNRES